MPAMWEAIGALSVILIDLGEFDAARSLVDAIMPQVSLFHSSSVISDVLIPSRYWKAAIRLRLHSCTQFSQTLMLDLPARRPKRMQKRALVTLMPHSSISTEHMKVRIHRVFDALQIANEIQTAYVKVEDLDGTLDSLMKKAMLYKHRDDEDMIEEIERSYNSTVQEAERRQLAMQGQGVETSR